MVSRLRPHQLGLLMGVAGYTVISFESFGIRVAGLGEWDTAFWFGLFTAIAMSMLVPARTGRSLPSAVKDGGWVMVASGILQAMSTIFFILAIQFTTVSNAVVIFAATPVLAALVAHVVLKERTSTRMWMAIAASIVGILIVMSGSFGEGRISGDLFAVGAISAYTANLTIWRKNRELRRTVAIGLGGLVMAVVSALFADPTTVTLKAVLILLLLGGLMGPAGRVSVASSTRYLPTAQVSLLGPIETLGATAWAWLFLAEAPAGTTLVGGGIVLTAVLYGAASGLRGMRVPVNVAG
ncbi:MAG: DMT family transporter [Acidimicrobiia bacterium]|nr:DMT family transporter [Acidimicrobiia bacterium]